MTQAAKKKEDTRSVKLIKAQSNQVQQLTAEKEALGKKLGEQQKKTLTEKRTITGRIEEKRRGDCIFAEKATSSCPSPEESYWFNDDGLSSERDEADYLEG